MAAVIGDLASDVSRLRDLIVNPSSLQHPRQPPSRSRACDAPSSVCRSPTPRPHHNRRLDADKADPAGQDSQQPASLSTSSSSLCHAPELAVSRFPSPPLSSSPRSPFTDATTTDGNKDDNDEKSAAASMTPTTQAAACPLVFAEAGPMSYQQQPQQPSPPADDFRIPASAAAAAQKQAIVRVRDLAHVQALAATQALGANGGPHTKYEISAMPMADVIEMVSALLTKITNTNDLQHDATQRNVAHQQQASQNSDAVGGSQMSPLSHSVLAFHGKNVPAISILSYLSRIHKYCPTTYEVFLSLLVYFDRMTERVNDLIIKTHRSDSPQDAVMADGKPPAAPEFREIDWDLSDDDHMADAPDPSAADLVVAAPAPTPRGSRSVTYFVVDSFNIHRLIIAGVTCASKFFSDVFYTNSRYAKVGGLPLAELNHLEIQFLVLNDFRLAVPVEDLEAYATMLVEFYAREVIAQKAAGSGPEA